MHLTIVVLTMLIIPLFCVYAQKNGDEQLIPLIGKWFLFWGAGVRLTIAGIRQIIAPQLTVEGIFGVHDPRIWPLAQELGFWNLSVGILCMVTLLRYEWRQVLALASGLFFLAAGVKHVLSDHRTLEANTAMVSDIGIAAVLLGFAAFSALVSKNSGHK